MKLFNKIRLAWSKRQHKPVELTQEQLTDMRYYETHEWPTPPNDLVAGESVWVLGKGRVPAKGVVAKLRKVYGGNPYWLIRYGENMNHSEIAHVGEPVFRNRQDLLLWYIGEAWRNIARLYGNLQHAVGDVQTVQEYTNNRVGLHKAEIKFLENQFVMQSPDEVDWNREVKP